MLTLRLAIAACAWLFAVPSCGLIFGSKAADKQEQRPPAEDVSVAIDNHNWSDIVIYLMRGTQAQRLGMVTALSTIEFAFPYSSLNSGGNLRLKAYPIGGSGAFTSEDLQVQPGQMIKWTLESDLSRSFLAIY
jgi:hypothetical protein